MFIEELITYKHSADYIILFVVLSYLARFVIHNDQSWFRFTLVAAFEITASWYFNITNYFIIDIFIIIYLWSVIDIILRFRKNI